MKTVRTLSGLLALIALVIGFNLLVLRQSPFAPAVVAALGAGIALGLIWLIVSLITVSRHSAAEGRTLHRVNTILTAILFLGICIVAYAFIQHRGGAWDLTQEGRRQLSPQTIQVLQTLNTSAKDVDVICFFMQIDDELVAIAQQKTHRFLDQCKTYSNRLHVEFLDPQVERARLEGLGITHASTQGTVVIRCGLRQRVITLSGASPRLEEREFTNTLINVIRDSQPKVCFLTGHGERRIDDTDERTGGSILKQLLEGESYQAEPIGITITNAEIPPDCDILVINALGLQGPRADLHPEEIRAIQEYIGRGGRLLVLLDPWRKVSTDKQQVEQLRPWLARQFGINVGEDMAVSPRSKWTVEFDANVAPFNDKDPMSPFRGCFHIEHMITRAFDQKVIFSAARTVSLSPKLPENVIGVELLRTTPDFYAETDLATLMSTGKAVRTQDETIGPLPMAAAVTVKTDFLIGDSGQTRDARIVVIGDSDFASNSQLTVIPGNLNLVLNVIGWLSETKEVIAIRPSGKEDPPILLSESDERRIVYIAVLGTLQMVIAAGLAVYFWRRKYQ